MKLAHFGTFDVENYGDLLFPLVLEQRLGDLCNEFVHVSPAGGLPVWGDCVPTISPEQLLEETDKPDAVVLGGGHIVHTAPGTVEPYRRNSVSALAYPSLWLGASYLAAKEGIPLCWNSPGIPRAFGAVSARHLRWAVSLGDYVSVRDRNSRRLLADAGVEEKIEVVPDTALEVSRLWTADEIEDAYANAFEQRGRDVPDRSLAFHLNLRYVDESVDSLAARLDRICRERDATAILIALEPCHGDDEFQSRVARRMTTNPLLIERPQSLREAAACIASSEAYFGSSLHGMITACSFGVRGMLVASEKKTGLKKFTGFLEQFNLTSWMTRTWSEAEGRVGEFFNAPPSTWKRILEVASPALDRHWERVRAALTEGASDETSGRVRVREIPEGLRSVGGTSWGEGIFQGILEENSERLLQDLKKKNESLAQLEQRRHRATDQRVEFLQAELQAEELQAYAQSVHRTSREVKLLTAWLDRLEAGISALLGSRQWRAGRALGEVQRRLLRRPRVPAAPEHLNKVLDEFHGWRENSKQGTISEGGVSPLQMQARESSDGDAHYILDVLKNLAPVTVVVPIHNAHDDLGRCLEALIKNTNSPAKLLLIDDVSTDSRVSTLLGKYEGFENVRVLTNEENLGFVRTINRGLAESGGDVVILNSDTEVTPRWLENLTLAAHMNPLTATATPVSNNAGAFSVPEVGQRNDLPENLTRDAAGRVVMQQSENLYPLTPTGNGFCMFIKQEAIEEVGGFDAENFPVGYAEENDFCMKAQKLGWNHVVDDATLVLHKRSASFGERQKELLKSGREVLDRLHPEYTQLARSFVKSRDIEDVRFNVQTAYENAESGLISSKPRVLFVIHQAQGGTPHTNRDLMSALADRYSPYLLLSDALSLKLFRLGEKGLVLLEEHRLRNECKATEFSRPDYRSVIFSLLARYRFELIHIRHLLGHTFDLPEVAARMRVPMILSFHDFYFSCPTIHLIDDNTEHCGGTCTPGSGKQCTILHKKLRNELPILKHAWLDTWRTQVRRMFGNVDTFVTTSEASREVYLRSYPSLASQRFEIIEHGRDLQQSHHASPPRAGEPIRILLPGNINVHKGGEFIRELKKLDHEERLEFHFLGNVTGGFEDLGVMHGPYERGEFNDRVGKIYPSFIGVFSIWPETYCHTLTEAWAAGVPVLATDIGTLRERVQSHGGGWLLDYKNPRKAYERILEVAGDSSTYTSELGCANLKEIRSTEMMSLDYANLYESVLDQRRAFVAEPHLRQSSPTDAASV